MACGKLQSASHPSCVILLYDRRAISVDRKREQTLIRAAQQGNSKAFAEIYRAYVDNIFRYIYYKVESTAMAEDLTAEVFLRMLEGLPTYEDRGTPLLVWLYRIAHARVVDHYRRTQRAGDQEDIEEADPSIEDDADVPLMAQYKYEQVRSAIRSLTDGQRQVIIMRFVEGHNLETTARLLNKTIDSIKAMQYRALQALGQALRRQGYHPDED